VIDDFYQMLRVRGIEHERTVLNAYTAKVGAEGVVKARDAEHTMELIREKTPIIYQVTPLSQHSNNATTT
jgi:hypothetical protein